MGGLWPKDYNMFFNAIPTFHFSDENVKTHALNVKKLSEWLTFKECHLGLSHCNELTAIAFGFKTLQDLKEHLTTAEFISLELSKDIIKDLELALKKFCPPLAIMTMKDEEPEPFTRILQESLKTESGFEEVETPLQQCQEFWKNWHSKFAVFLSKYFHEVHRNFKFFESLELISLSKLGGDSLALGNGADDYTTFLNIVIFNHLNSQYVGDYDHYHTFSEKEVIFDNDVQKRQYVISSGLHQYLSDNHSNINFIRENLHDSNKPLFTQYDKNTQQAVLNLILCKKYMVDDHYVPTFVHDGMKAYRDEMRSLSFDIKGEANQFSFALPYIYDGEWLNNLDTKPVVFTESDLRLAILDNSFLLQNLKGYTSNFDATRSSLAEFIFPMKWNDEIVFDVTETSFKMKDVFRVQYAFKKDIGTPFISRIGNKLENLQAVYELIISSHVYATVEFSIVDSKIKIKFSDIKTKLSPILQNIPVKVHFLVRNCETQKYYTYENGNLHLKISGLEKRASFKKMLDQHLYLQPYKQLIQKEDCLEIYQCHKTEWMQQVS